MKTEKEKNTLVDQLMEKSFKDFLDEKLKQAKPIIIEKCRGCPYSYVIFNGKHKCIKFNKTIFDFNYNKCSPKECNIKVSKVTIKAEDWPINKWNGDFTISL